MTWRRQVRAVVVKDLRQHWWMLALLAGVLTMAVLRLTVAQPAVTGSFGWYGTFIPILIIWISTGVVRADPPAISTAFWATQPLEPSAVAAAKLAQALCVSGMACIAAAMALRWWGIAWSDVPAAALQALIASTTVAIGGVALATSGSESRGPLLGIAAAVVAFYTVAHLTPSWVLWSRDLPTNWIWSLMLACTIAAFARSYALREVSVPWRLGGAALVALLGLCALKTFDTPALTVTAGASVPALSITVPPPDGASDVFRMTLDGLHAAATDIRVVDAFVRIEQPDGTALRVPVTGVGIPVNTGPVTPSQRRAGVGRDPVHWTIRITSARESDREWKPALRRGARITFEGTIAEFAQTTLYRTAIVAGPITAAPRQSRHALAIVSTDTGTFAQFEARWFVPANADPMFDFGMPAYRMDFRIVNRATGRSLGDVGRTVESGNGSEAIPGIRIVDQRAELGFGRGPQAPVTDSAWRAAHELVVSAPTVARAYRAHASTLLSR
jgi:hypothetical protein